MSDGKFLDGLSKLGRVFKQSKIPELAGVVLGETPIGKVGRIIKGAAEILGVDESPSAIADALEKATPEQRVALAEFAAREREAEESTKQEMERTEQEAIRAVTERHAADMMGDVPINKIIRPALTIALTASAVHFSYLILNLYLLSFLIPSLEDRSPMGDNLVLQALIFLWGGASVATGFYFKGRSGEKETSIRAAADIFMKR